MKYESLRIYKSGKQVLDEYKGGAKMIEPFTDSKGRIIGRVFEPVKIIYVFKETPPKRGRK